MLLSCVWRLTINGDDDDDDDDEGHKVQKGGRVVGVSYTHSIECSYL